MITCQICQETFKNNLGGQLTIHLSEQHGITMEDYVVQTDFGGTPPTCACGLCDERPVFARGKFLTHAMNHRKFKVKEELYIKKHGLPTCEDCGKIVKFCRGIPSRFCSGSCAGKHHGFSLPSTQEEIRKVVKEKYGVDNIFQIEDVKRRCKNKNANRVYPSPSESTKKKISAASKKLWENPEYRKIMENLKFSDEEKVKR